jgi:WD40 repeat protein
VTDVAATAGSERAIADLPPIPSRWRRLVPAPLRSLLWADDRRSYDAFLSYSWAADRERAAVLQSVLQKFLCPWYSVRALNVFRDLSSLAANSSLAGALRDRLDKSKHLIVLASPEAATSAGMEFEAQYWFSRPRSGDVIVVVTKGEFAGWTQIRDSALPPTLRTRLHDPPLWLDMSALSEEILNRRKDPRLHAELVDRLRQLILVFYPTQTWESLQGEERDQRRRAVGLIVIVASALVAAGAIAYGQRQNALRQTAVSEQERRRAEQATIAEVAATQSAAQQAKIATLQTRLADEEAAQKKEAQNLAQAEELAASADALSRSRPSVSDRAAEQAIAAVVKHPSPLTEGVLRSMLSVLPPLVADLAVPCRPMVAAIDPSRRLVAFGDSDGRLCVVDLPARQSVFNTHFERSVAVEALVFETDGSLVAATNQLFADESVIRVFSPSNWKDYSRDSVRGRVTRVALSPDQRWIAIGTADGTVSVANWLEHRASSQHIVSSGEHQEISVLAFGPRGQQLFVGSGAALEAWRNWDTQQPEKAWFRRFEKDALPFFAGPPLTVDPNRGVFATAHHGVIEITALDGLRLLQKIQMAAVDALAFNAQGWLTAHVRDEGFRTWWRPRVEFVKADRQQYTTKTLSGELTTARSLATSGDGEYVVARHVLSSAATENWASLLQIASGEEVGRFYHLDQIWHFFPLEQGSSGVTLAEHRVRIWGDILARNGMTSHGQRELVSAATDGGVAVAAVALEANVLASAKTVQVWDLTKAALIDEREIQETVRAVRVRDARRVDIATDDGLGSWTPATGREPSKLVRFPPMASRCARVAALPADSDAFAISAGTGEVWIGGRGGLHHLGVSALPTSCVAGLAIAPSGSHVAVSYVANGPRLFVLDTGSGAVRLNTQTPYQVQSMAFDAGGERLAFVSRLAPRSTTEAGESGIQLWSVMAGTRLADKGLNMIAGPQTMCLSADGTLLGTSQGALAQVWSYSGGADLQLRATEPLRTSMRSCQFSDDGKRMMASDGFGTRVMRLDPKDLVADARVRIRSNRSK